MPELTKGMRTTEEMLSVCPCGESVHRTEVKASLSSVFISASLALNTFCRYPYTLGTKCRLREFWRILNVEIVKLTFWWWNITMGMHRPLWEGIQGSIHIKYHQHTKTTCLQPWVVPARSMRSNRELSSLLVGVEVGQLKEKWWTHNWLEKMEVEEESLSLLDWVRLEGECKETWGEWQPQRGTQKQENTWCMTK